MIEIEKREKKSEKSKSVKNVGIKEPTKSGRMDMWKGSPLHLKGLSLGEDLRGSKRKYNTIWPPSRTKENLKEAIFCTMLRLGYLACWVFKSGLKHETGKIGYLIWNLFIIWCSILPLIYLLSCLMVLILSPRLISFLYLLCLTMIMMKVCPNPNSSKVCMIRKHMEKKIEQYARSANRGRKEVLFKERDIVWLHWRKERLPHLKRSKLLPRGDDLFKILKKINDNAYQVDMPQDFWESTTFNPSMQGFPRTTKKIEVTDKNAKEERKNMVEIGIDSPLAQRTR
ncbi:hypothetical protein CR513_06436, partial [Mucuna pruriens]